MVTKTREIVATEADDREFFKQWARDKQEKVMAACAGAVKLCYTTYTLCTSIKPLGDAWLDDVKIYETLDEALDDFFAREIPEQRPKEGYLYTIEVDFYAIDENGNEVVPNPCFDTIATKGVVPA